MKKYRVFLDQGYTIDLSEEELQRLFDPHFTDDVDLRAILSDQGDKLIINLNFIIFIQTIVVVSPLDAVVTPPDAETIRNQEEEKKAERVSSLSNIIAANRGEEGDLNEPNS